MRLTSAAQAVRFRAAPLSLTLGGVDARPFCIPSKINAGSVSLTAIATFSVTGVPFLVADTLETHFMPPLPDSPSWISTGVRVEGITIREGALKIWPIQENIALACAGHASTGDALLEVICERARARPFDDLEALRSFLTKSAIPSITPVRGRVELCGFLGDSSRSPAIHAKIDPQDGTLIHVAEEEGMRFTVGTGGHLFEGILERIRAKEPVDARTLLDLFETQLYIRQFIDPAAILDARSGGAILGLFWTPDGLQWSRPRTVVAFKNVGGAGRSAEFVPLPVLYRVWGEDGRFCTSAAFEQGGAWYQRLTSYGNQAISPVALTPHELPPEALSFNANRITTILLPDRDNAFPACLGSPGGTAFSEMFEGGFLRAWRFCEEWAQCLAERFWVKPDRTIAIFGNAQHARASDIVNALANDALGTSDRLSLLVDLAHTFRRWGSDYGFTPAFEDGLKAWLNAVQVCDEGLLERRPDVVHDLEVYLGELAQNAPDHLETALNNLRDLIDRVSPQMPEACRRTANGKWIVHGADDGPAGKAP